MIFIYEKKKSIVHFFFLSHIWVKINFEILFVVFIIEFFKIKIQK